MNIRVLYILILSVLLPITVLGGVAFALDPLPYDPNYTSLKVIKIDHRPDTDVITTGASNPKVRFYLIISFFDGFSEKFVKETLQPLRKKYESIRRAVFKDVR